MIFYSLYLVLTMGQIQDIYVEYVTHVSHPWVLRVPAPLRLRVSNCNYAHYVADNVETHDFRF